MQDFIKNAALGNLLPTEDGQGGQSGWMLLSILRSEHYAELFSGTRPHVRLGFSIVPTKSGGLGLVIVFQRETSGLQHRVVLSLNDESTKAFVHSLLSNPLWVRFEDGENQGITLLEDAADAVKAVLEWTGRASPMRRKAEIEGLTWLALALLKAPAVSSLFCPGTVTEAGITIIRPEGGAPKGAPIH